jgi:hypothetical protein
MVTFLRPLLASSSASSIAWRTLWAQAAVEPAPLKLILYGMCTSSDAEPSALRTHSYLTRIKRHDFVRRPFLGEEETTMNVSTTGAVERIARVLAGQRLSANADGRQTSAGEDVDAEWRRYRSDAVAVLKTLREPDEAMAQAGDVATWERMVRAALAEAGEAEPFVRGESHAAPEPGTDPLHEGP